MAVIPLQRNFLMLDAGMAQWGSSSDSWLEVFLCEVCMPSSCLCGFSQGTLASSHLQCQVNNG